MISAAVVENRILKALDADTEDANGRYSWEHGIREAVNYAIDFTMAVFDAAIAAKKVSEIVLTDLMASGYAISGTSRISIHNFNYWTILSFHPVGSSSTGGFGSRTTYRLTTEETSNVTRNCFVPGNNFQTGEMLDYAHEYEGNGNVRFYPPIPNFTEVGVRYLKNPSYMEQVTSDLESEIEFPQNVTNLIVEKALEFIGKKEAGEQLTYTMSEKEVTKLLSLL